MNGGHFCDGVTVTQPPAPGGVEYCGVYDGVLHWACPACGLAWHRFDALHPLRGRAEPYVNRWNVEHRSVA